MFLLPQLEKQQKKNFSKIFLYKSLLHRKIFFVIPNLNIQMKHAYLLGNRNYVILEVQNAM